MCNGIAHPAKNPRNPTWCEVCGSNHCYLLTECSYCGDINEDPGVPAPFHGRPCVDPLEARAASGDTIAAAELAARRKRLGATAAQQRAELAAQHAVSSKSWVPSRWTAQQAAETQAQVHVRQHAP